MAADIMIDLETLDTSPFCCILSIGVVLFDPKGSGIIDKIELRPTLEDQTELGRTINEDTIRWWSTQSSGPNLRLWGMKEEFHLKKPWSSCISFVGIVGLCGLMEQLLTAWLWKQLGPNWVCEYLGPFIQYVIQEHCMK